jgi:hypothetical protein
LKFELLAFVRLYLIEDRSWSLDYNVFLLATMLRVSWYWRFFDMLYLLIQFISYLVVW